MSVVAILIGVAYFFVGLAWFIGWCKTLELVPAVGAISMWFFAMLIPYLVIAK